MKNLSSISLAWLCTATIAAVLGGCGGSGGGSVAAPDTATSAPTAYRYQMPGAVADGWAVSHLNDERITTAPIERLVNQIQQQAQGYRYIDALLIARNGKLVLDQRVRQQLDFIDGRINNRDIDLHALHSVTKSVVATLIGIALDQGKLPSIDATVYPFFPDRAPFAHGSADKAGITVRHWLTMQSGYDWDESLVPYTDPANIVNHFAGAPDPLKFVLDLPLTQKPGSVFSYSTGVSYGLGALVERVNNQALATVLDQQLLTPLDIRNHGMWQLGGMPHMGAGLYLSLRDASKFGQLYLNGGTWNGRRLVSANWIAQATQPHVALVNGAYGYQWWVTTFHVGSERYESYYMNGWGGQYVFVVPRLNAVVGFLGNAYTEIAVGARDVRAIMENELLPAMQR